MLLNDRIEWPFPYPRVELARDLDLFRRLAICLKHFARQSQSSLDGIFSRYAKLAPVDRCLALRFAGVEIMRRLIGVAQLPVRFGLERKTELLQLSRALVLEGRAA